MTNVPPNLLPFLPQQQLAALKRHQGEASAVRVRHTSLGLSDSSRRAGGGTSHVSRHTSPSTVDRLSTPSTAPAHIRRYQLRPILVHIEYRPYHTTDKLVARDFESTRIYQTRGCDLIWSVFAYV